MGSHAKRKRTWLAILAAFVLFAHSLVAGFVDGAMAEPRLLDVFGNPICSSHDAGGGSPDQPANHSHLPDCCLVGCSLVGGHALAAAAQPFLILRLAEPARRAAPGYRAARVTPERSPLNPRAPPGSV
jgi:hypothetical protein